MVDPAVNVGASKSVAYCAYAAEDTRNAAENSVKSEELFMMVAFYVLHFWRASQNGTTSGASSYQPPRGVWGEHPIVGFFI
jgi:hypothetical protein